MSRGPNFEIDGNGIITSKTEKAQDVHDIAFDLWWATVSSVASELPMKGVAMLAFMKGTGHGLDVAKQMMGETLSKPRAIGS